MITPAVEEIRRHTERRFSSEFALKHAFNLGVYNRRKIANSSVWSQHSWGNAWDIGIGTNLTLGDTIYDWLVTEKLAKRLPIGTILWRVKNHFDHIHVEGLPKRFGVPPFTPTTPIGDSEMELTKMIQRALVAEGFTDAAAQPLTVDGKPGPNTEFALRRAFKAARESAPTGIPYGATVKIVKP